MHPSVFHNPSASAVPGLSNTYYPVPGLAAAKTHFLHQGHATRRCLTHTLHLRHHVPSPRVPNWECEEAPPPEPIANPEGATGVIRRNSLTVACLLATRLRTELVPGHIV